MMTREEAIELLEERKKFNRTMQRGWEQSEGVTASGKTVNTASFAKQHKDEADALDLAISALRPVSREQVEKVWKGEWIHPHWSNDVSCADCKRCGKEACHRLYHGVQDYYNFCPACGAPMTDEAVEMMVERMEVLKDGKGD